MDRGNRLCAAETDRLFQPELALDRELALELDNRFNGVDAFYEYALSMTTVCDS